MRKNLGFTKSTKKASVLAAAAVLSLATAIPAMADTVDAESEESNSNTEAEASDTYSDEQEYSDAVSSAVESAGVPDSAQTSITETSSSADNTTVETSTSTATWTDETESSQGTPSSEEDENGTVTDISTAASSTTSHSVEVTTTTTTTVSKTEYTDEATQPKEGQITEEDGTVKDQFVSSETTTDTSKVTSVTTTDTTVSVSTVNKVETTGDGAIIGSKTGTTTEESDWVIEEAPAPLDNSEEGSSTSAAGTVIGTQTVVTETTLGTAVTSSSSTTADDGTKTEVSTSTKTDTATKTTTLTESGFANLADAMGKLGIDITADGATYTSQDGKQKYDVSVTVDGNLTTTVLTMQELERPEYVQNETNTLDKATWEKYSSMAAGTYEKTLVMDENNAYVMGYEQVTVTKDGDVTTVTKTYVGLAEPIDYSQYSTDEKLNELMSLIGPTGILTTNLSLDVQPKSSVTVDDLDAKNKGQNNIKTDDTVMIGGVIESGTELHLNDNTKYIVITDKEATIADGTQGSAYTVTFSDNKTLNIKTSGNSTPMIEVKDLASVAARLDNIAKKAEELKDQTVADASMASVDSAKVDCTKVDGTAYANFSLTGNGDTLSISSILMVANQKAILNIDVEDKNGTVNMSSCTGDKDSSTVIFNFGDFAGTIKAFMQHMSNTCVILAPKATVLLHDAQGYGTLVCNVAGSDETKNSNTVWNQAGVSTDRSNSTTVTTSGSTPAEEWVEKLNETKIVAVETATKVVTDTVTTITASVSETQVFKFVSNVVEKTYDYRTPALTPEKVPTPAGGGGGGTGGTVHVSGGTGGGGGSGSSSGSGDGGGTGLHGINFSSSSSGLTDLYDSTVPLGLQVLGVSERDEDVQPELQVLGAWQVLPQTGLMWLPIPLMMMGGAALLAASRKKEDEE